MTDMTDTARLARLQEELRQARAIKRFEAIIIEAGENEEKYGPRDLGDSVTCYLADMQHYPERCTLERAFSVVTELDLEQVTALLYEAQEAIRDLQKCAENAQTWADVPAGPGVWFNMQKLDERIEAFYKEQRERRAAY